MCLFNYLKLYFSALLFITTSLKASQSWGTDYLSCVQNGSCNCTYNNGDVIDLMPLSNRTQPFIVASKSYLYAYHPCKDVQLKSVVKNNCQDKYGVCYFVPNETTQEHLDFNSVLSNKTFGSFRKLAVNEEAVFRMNEKEEVEIVYKDTENGTVTTTIIKLYCDHGTDGDLAFEKSNSKEHVLSLTSKYACPKSTHHITGVGAFFLIITVMIAIYFFGGILVLKFIRGAKGVEMIPNHEFWCRVVNLVKYGFAYVISCGKTSSDSYEKI